jgi:hypothetical protein
MSWTPESMVRAELQPGETIRWLGTPSFVPMFVNQAPQFFFGLVFLTLPGSGFWSLAVEFAEGKTATGSIAFILFLGIFVCIGFLGSAGALWNVLATWRTVYAVTDRRLLIISGFHRHHVLAVAPSAINAVERRERSDGSGSVTFRRETVDTGEGTSTKKLMFVGVRDVREAANQIEKLRNAAA